MNKKGRQKIIDEIGDIMKPYYRYYENFRDRNWTEQEIYNIFYEDIWRELIEVGLEESGGDLEYVKRQLGTFLLVFHNLYNEKKR